MRQYTVGPVIGSGSFGAVYRAEFQGDAGFKKTVALKLLKEDLTDRSDTGDRLRDEARLLGLVRHRAIVGADTLARLGNRWCVVMEYVDGADLGELVRLSGPVPVSAACEVLAEVSGALHAAHSGQVGDRALGVLHRDVKPGNIRLTALGGVKLLDFGIARADFEGREAQSGQMFFGSLPYMSPERFAAVDSAAGDVYALGAVFAEMLLGQRIGQTTTDEAKHGRRLVRVLEAVARMGHPPEAQALLESMLAYRAVDRPAARAVEAQATALARAFGGPALRDWLEQWVPQAQHFQEEHRDHRFGTVLVEGDDGTLDSISIPAATWAGNEASLEQEPGELRPLPPSPSPPDAAVKRRVVAPGHVDAPAMGRRSSPLLATSLALGIPIGVALGAATMVGGVGWWWYHRAPVQSPGPVLAPVDEAPVAVLPELSPPPEPSRPRSRPAAEPVVATAEGESVTAATGRVSVTGDATSVWFESPAGRSGAGELTEGSYLVMATFSDGLSRKAGTVVVGAGTTVVVHCVEEFTRCRVE